MNSYKSAIGVALLAISLAACDHSMYRSSATPIPGYGNAIRQNNSVMIIDPQPATAANTDLDLDGRRAGIAIERYRQNKVIPPIPQSTTDVLSGS
jgi:hypothetical protein